jgi:predicted XRE-type DNA-binding protein
MGNFRLCTFGQTMVQTPGSAVWGTSDLKDLRIVSGQTMVQKRPNDGSSHISTLRDRDRQIVTLYHQQGLTMRQVAELMRVDDSRISQLHAAALVRLKANVDTLLRPGEAETSEACTLPLAGGRVA